MADAATEGTSLLDNENDNDTTGQYLGTQDGETDLLSSIRWWRDKIHRSVLQHVGEIGMLGSVSIAVNSLTGPAMLNLPATFQKSGFIPTVAALVFSCMLSAMCSLHTANVISKVPGNGNFKREIEYCDVFREFLGQRWFYLSQTLFFCCITCLNVSSIVDTAQVVDTMLGHWFPGGSGAFMFSTAPLGTEWVRWDYTACSEKVIESGNCIPFFEEENGLLLTAGYMISMVLLLPLSLLDLKENSFSQVIGFVILILCSIQFATTFIASGLDTTNMSWWGTSWDSLMGVIIFNFALVLAIPAWLYEKKEEVDVTTVINGSSLLSVILYVVIGGLGALSVPNVSENMLESMMSGSLGKLTQVSASAFAFFIIGFGVPLFSVLTRLSLTGGEICSTTTANILAVYLPFGLSWIFYQGDAITSLLSWGGVIFTSLVAFILPLIIAMYSLNMEADDAADDRDDHQTTYEGSVNIYGTLWENRTKQGEMKLLILLMAAAIASICAAIVGNLF